MRHFDSNDKYDQEEAVRNNLQPWHLELLAMNPAYCAWGNHEDYMMERDGGGWNASQRIATVGELWGLNDLNECVNFYFEILRPSETCPNCGGNGYHLDAQWVSESFYGHSSPFRDRTQGEREAVAIMDSFGGATRDTPLGRNTFPTLSMIARYGEPFRQFCEDMKRGDGSWGDGPLTEDERKALKDAGREPDGGRLGHDAINRGILVEARCKRLGLPLYCETCQGHGFAFTSDEPTISLQLWMLHPRKGCSRGLVVEVVERHELSTVFAWLREAADRNAERFARVPSEVPA